MKLGQEAELGGADERSPSKQRPCGPFFTLGNFQLGKHDVLLVFWFNWNAFRKGMDVLPTQTDSLGTFGVIKKLDLSNESVKKKKKSEFRVKHFR